MIFSSKITPIIRIYTRITFEFPIKLKYKMTTILDYNTNLINKLIKIELIDYFNEIHDKFYNTIDISFMKYFLDICDQPDEFIVDQDKLKEYGVINNLKPKDIIKCLEQYNFRKDKEYHTDNVVSMLNGGRVYNKTLFKLTPESFKLCLIRSKNSKIYAHYYLLLEKVFKYYSIYQKEYSNKILSIKDEKIDEQSDKIDKQTNKLKKQSKKLKEQSLKIDELLKKADEVLYQNKEIKVQNEDLKFEVEDLGDRIDILHDDNINLETKIDIYNDNLKDRAPVVSDSDYLHHFIVFQDNNNSSEFLHFKGQLKHINNKINKYKDSHRDIINNTYNANPISLFTRIREQVDKLNKKEEERIKLLKISNIVKRELLKEHRSFPLIKIKNSSITINKNKYSSKELVDLINNCESDKYEISEIEALP